MNRHMPHMHLRSFLIYQTNEGWFWNWPGLNRSVGPFPTLPEVLADLQHVMGVGQHPIEITEEELKIVEQAFVGSKEKT